MDFAILIFGDASLTNIIRIHLHIISVAQQLHELHQLHIIRNNETIDIEWIALEDVDDDFECLVLVPQFGNIISGKITVRVVLRCAVGVGRIHFFCICFLFPKLGS